MSQFPLFARMLAIHFTQLSASELHRVAIDGDDLWQAYLAAFPEGTNPIFRVRTVHDGSYDRSVIRKIGNVVRLNEDGTVTSIWDIPDLPAPYDTVAQRLADLVHAADIDTVFRINEHKLSVVRNVENRDGVTTEFHHLHADIAARHFTREVASFVGNANTTVAVMRRGFEEITPEAVSTVLELIQQGSLYRGDEFKSGLQAFQAAQNLYLRQNSERQRNFLLWLNAGNGVARLRNTAIGTLLQDLSSGMDLESAVRRWETLTAPTNYKRPTALVTQGMIDKALTTIDELGLRSALERRFAVIEDVSINNVLWADNSVQPLMRDGLRDLLITATKPTNVTGTPTEVTVDHFMQDILPTATSMELLFSGVLQPNLMSLTAPVHADAAPLFKWGNGFAWSYSGNITDSIKEKVKAAGGNINAKLRVSLAWSNYDDLDLHAMCPDGHVYYSNKIGILDVDMNAGGRRQSRSPVENLSWSNPRNGVYTIVVNNYYKVETEDQGFTLEVANNGKVTHFSFPRNDVDHMSCLQFTVQDGIIADLKILAKGMTGQGIAQNIWGITTEQFIKVDTVLNSPNHWDGERTGNKHWFFILEGCKNPEPTRGIYNEFLKSELEEHRKVFEVLGNKTKCLPSDAQLSGLGFSSTQRNSVVIRVTTATSTRLYQVNF